LPAPGPAASSSFAVAFAPGALIAGPNVPDTGPGTPRMARAEPPPSPAVQIAQTRYIVFLTAYWSQGRKGGARGMFERFTDQARRVVVLAQEEARMLNHDYIGTEHILLALIRESTGVAARALESLGITEEAARQQAEQIIGRGEQDPPRGHLPFTPRGKKTLELSLREAIALGSISIGTEHILLGLIREGEGKNPATQVLNGLGIDPNRVRQQVIALVAARRGEQEAGARGVTAGGGKRKLTSEVRGRLDSIEWRLSVLEQRVGTGPDERELDREIGQLRRDKEAAIDAQDFENAAVLRDRESQLLSDKAARLQEWAALPSLTDEVERLRDLLRRHGIDPQDGAA
jgi:ATP-dependent Clp protease ATP-binding subunit ClpA